MLDQARTSRSEGAAEGRGALLSRCKKTGFDSFTLPRAMQFAGRPNPVNHNPTTVRRHTMRWIAALALVVALTGCGARSTSDAGHHFPMPDQDAAQNAFLESVREYYATRSDGKLSDPGISGPDVRFIYRYDKIVNGNHTEEVRFNGIKDRKVRRNDGTYVAEPATYQVGAWYQREGADPEVPAIRDAIVAGMQKRLAPKP